MHSYNPFAVEIASLSTTDLVALKDVVEGWYIEYKSELQSAANLAKSISAFANTYGGWLFIGVAEASKEQPTAGTFPGIPRENVDAYSQRIRKSAADHLHPSPHFELRVLWGPNGDLGLADDRAIICVWIPQSNMAPHVQKNGVVYRRVSDASEPRPENDRFVLDQLFRRADELKARYKTWYDQDPAFAENEKDTPYVRLMLTADLWRERDLFIESEDEIRQIMGDADSPSAIPFDNIYRTASGFIGRQLLGNDLHQLTLTWHLRNNLVSDVYVPLTIYRPDHLVDLKHTLIGYENVDRFIEILHQFRPSAVRVIDLNFLFHILLGVANLQRRILRKANWLGPYYFKAKILNSWRTVPFIDSAMTLDQFEKFGPSMCLESTTVAPPGFALESFVTVAWSNEVEDELGAQLRCAYLMFNFVSEAFGVSPSGINTDSEKLTQYLVELEQAGHRAVKSQSRRNDILRRMQ
jgi:hypothetical protein